MSERISVSVQGYDPARGAVADVEGGSLVIGLDDEGVSTGDDAAGLRDLARWCRAIVDDSAPEGVHVHLEPGTAPLEFESLSVVIHRLR